ncbi:hypothetical protein AGMMS49545_03620 [Betaproteobacteria bacterium]|nr:hypothetical protein AGMMS49545_03620 [Betaproteobacteria bacterium]GHU41714.1 hypothetical protein AGMMS50289_05300 [Betaproteobacteria bacterium]
MTYIYILAFAVGLTLIVHLLTRMHVGYLQQKGIYPKAGSENMQDVQRLLERGERLMAMRCYRKVTGKSLRQTKQFFEDVAANPRHMAVSEEGKK